MGKRGPIPFPSAVKERRGTLEKSREVSNQPEIPPSVPERPEWLSEAAAQMYDELAPVLCAAQLLTDADGASLARLCSYRALIHELLPALNASNVTQQNPVHGESLSGQVKAVLALEEKVRGLEDRFGLNPAARCRIAIPKATDGSQDAAADFA